MIELGRRDIDQEQIQYPNLDRGEPETAAALARFCSSPDSPLEEARFEPSLPLWLGAFTVPALRELGRVVRPGGLIRLLEYARPRGTLRRIVSRLWDPWITWAYGASFDRQTERHVPAAGLEIVESRYVVDDLVKLLTLRTQYRGARCG